MCSTKGTFSLECMEVSDRSQHYGNLLRAGSLSSGLKSVKGVVTPNIQRFYQPLLE